MFLRFGGIVSLASAATSSPDFRPDQILIKPKPGTDSEVLAHFHDSQHAQVIQAFNRLGDLQVVQLPEGATVVNFLNEYRDSGLVEFAEPDYRVHAAAIPNDPYFLAGYLWGLHNWGQFGGAPGADIDAEDGWNTLTSANNVVVAILDTGVRYTHEDLASNMWSDIATGAHGINAVASNLDPNDDNGHGTVVAGVLGAAGNNGIGVTGVAWQLQMMACKCLDSTGNGSDATVIASIEYAITNGAQIINASFDSAGYSDAVSNAIIDARSAGIIFVSSAGNQWQDLDYSPRYPACYEIDNIVSVAYTSRDDSLGLLSNFGATTVDVAAPGDEIFSTDFSSDNSYAPTNYPDSSLSGTSFAAAYVSGTLALMLAKYPGENYHQIISLLYATVDPLPSLAGECVTGGRVNLHKALSPPILLTPVPGAGVSPFELVVFGGPNRTCVLQCSSDLLHWTPVATNITSADGTFDFTDDQSAAATQRFYRAISTP